MLFFLLGKRDEINRRGSRSEVRTVKGKLTYETTGESFFYMVPNLGLNVHVLFKNPRGLHVLFPKGPCTSHNIVSPTMLGIVYTCKRTQQLPTLLVVDVVYSCPVILAMRVRRRFHETNIAVVLCKWTQHCCATLRRSQNNRNVGTC